jgi:hypothetical protein
MAGEPSWHRRARRVRSGQRLLAQVSAACVSLASHHGSEPPYLLRPLLGALSIVSPSPCDVPWPHILITSHRNLTNEIIPNRPTVIPNYFDLTGDDTSSNSSIIIDDNLDDSALFLALGDLRFAQQLSLSTCNFWRLAPKFVFSVFSRQVLTLPMKYWQNIHFRFSQIYRETYHDELQTALFIRTELLCRCTALHLLASDTGSPAPATIAHGFEQLCAASGHLSLSTVNMFLATLTANPALPQALDAYLVAIVLALP